MRRERFIFVVLIALALAACDMRAPVENAAEMTPADQVVGDGADQIRLTVSDTAITTAGRVRVTLRAPAGARVDETGFEGWTVADESRDATAGEWVWTLEPFLDGAYTVPGILVTLGEGEGAREVRTEAVDVVVASVLEEGDAELAGMKGVVDAPAADRRWVWASTAGAALVLAGGAVGLVMLLGARAREVYELRAPAHEVALARLDLAARDDSGGVEGLVVRVSDVVRRYIEDRWGVRAPERTTEEFLEECRGSVRFGDGDIELLDRFLTRVDLIKFAGASASDAQAEEAGEAVREFVRSTGSAESVVAVDEDEAARLDGVRFERVRVGYEFGKGGDGS